MFCNSHTCIIKVMLQRHLILQALHVIGYDIHFPYILQKKLWHWFNNINNIKCELHILRDKGIYLTQLLGSMTKPIPITENLKKLKRQHKTPYEIFDYTMITDRLRTLSWSNDSHQAGVVKLVDGIPTFPLTNKSVLSKGHTFLKL